MNRKIKFRCWHKVDGMRYVWGGWSKNIDVLEKVWNDINSFDYILMQWTGLKDKDGYDIYECDIIEDRFGNIKKVIWDDDSCSFRLLDIHQPLNYILLHNRGTYKIVGNIYEGCKIFTKFKNW